MDVFFTDKNTGWAIGDSGILLSTIDGGINWIEESNNETTTLRGLYFVNKNLGWYIGNGGTITKLIGTQYCDETDTDPNDVDTNPVYIGIPQAHDVDSTYANSPTANRYTVHVFDENNLVDDSTTNNPESQFITVEDVTPYISNAVDYTASTLTPTAGGSTAYNFTVTAKDNNGDTDITGADAVIYDGDDIELSSGTCTDDENDCYTDASCTLSNNLSGTDTDATVQCDFSAWFNINDGTNWLAHVNITDEQGSVTDQVDSNSFTVDALAGIDVVDTSIAYGAVEIGGSSSTQTVSVRNAGNQTNDLLLAGIDMTCSTPVSCGSSTIPLAQQKWGMETSTFNWGDSATGDGPFPLVDTAGTTGGTTGCFNQDLRKRSDHTSDTETNLDAYWKLQIPSGTPAGSYTGSVTFTTTNQCTAEICDNSTDDDGDGRTDCLDRHDCDLNPACTIATIPMRGLDHQLPTEYLTDGTMEAVGTTAWTVANSAILSKETTTPQQGSQVLRVTYGGVANPEAKQLTALTLGKTYRATGWARGDGGAGIPRFFLGSSPPTWTGTNSTSWQYFDVTNTTEFQSVILDVNTSSAGYAEFDNISVIEVNNHIDGDMEKTTVEAEWDTGGGTTAATLTKQTQTPHGGTRLLRVENLSGSAADVYTRQSEFTSGTGYRVTGWARSDGTHAPKIYQTSDSKNIWIGTTSTNWQQFDFTVKSGATGYELLFGGITIANTGYTEWDDIEVYEVAASLDLSGTQLHAILGDGSDSTTFPAQPKKPGYIFDGTDDYLTMLDHPGLQFGTNDFTIAGWIRLTDYTTASSQAIFLKQTDPNNRYGLFYRGDLAGDNLYGEIGDDVATQTISSADNPITDNLFHFVALVIDQTNSEGRIYVDGIQSGTSTTLTLTGNLSPTADLYIGNDGADVSPFGGIITDLKIFDTAFDSKQIKNLFFEQLSRFK